MAISVNGGSNPVQALYNNNDLNKVVYNGDIVWEKAAPKTIQSVIGTMVYETISNTYTTVYANISQLTVYFSDGTYYSDEFIEGLNRASQSVCEGVADGCGLPQSSVYFTFTSIDSDIYLEEPDPGGITIECAQSVVDNNDILGTVELHIGSFTLSADIETTQATGGKAYWGSTRESVYGNDAASGEILFRVPTRYYIYVTDPSELVGNTSFVEGQVYDRTTGPQGAYGYDVWQVTISGVSSTPYDPPRLIGTIELSLWNADTDEFFDDCTIYVYSAT